MVTATTVPDVEAAGARSLYRAAGRTARNADDHTRPFSAIMDVMYVSASRKVASMSEALPHAPHGSLAEVSRDASKQGGAVLVAEDVVRAESSPVEALHLDPGDVRGELWCGCPVVSAATERCDMGAITGLALGRLNASQGRGAEAAGAERERVINAVAVEGRISDCDEDIPQAEANSAKVGDRPGNAALSRAAPHSPAIDGLRLSVEKDSLATRSEGGGAAAEAAGTVGAAAEDEGRVVQASQGMRIDSATHPSRAAAEATPERAYAAEGGSHASAKATAISSGLEREDRFGITNSQAGGEGSGAAVGARDTGYPAPSRAEERSGAKTAGECLRQLPERIIVAARTMGRGETVKAQIRLVPESLGKLDLEVEWSGGLSIRLTAHSEEAYQAVRQGLPHLREALQAQGMHIEDLQLDIGGGGRGERGDATPQGGRFGKRAEDVAGIGTAVRAPAHRGVLDIEV